MNEPNSVTVAAVVVAILCGANPAAHVVVVFKLAINTDTVTARVMIVMNTTIAKVICAFFVLTSALNMFDSQEENFIDLAPEARLFENKLRLRR